jgi:SAM-dependent methyltransferase
MSRAETVALAPDERARLAEWLRLEGLPPGFPLEVHARDEMLPGLAVPSKTRPGRERLTYLRNGQEALLVLQHALAAQGRGLAAPVRLLELACGYGRVTRHLLGRVDAQRLTSCEIVPEAREFVARGLGVECLTSQADPARIAWPGRFDAIFVASLFSHLPRPRFEAWLAALRGAVADDGLAVLSTHGLWLPTAPRDDGHGFAFAPDSESLTLSRAEYGTTCVAPPEVARLARQAGWAEVRWLERELWALQDVFVLAATPLRDPGSAAPSQAQAPTWRPAPVLDGAIDGIESRPPSAAGADREIWLHGWVECRDPDEPVQRATLHLGPGAAGAVELHEARRTLRPPPDPARHSRAEWHHHAAVPAALGGQTTLALVAETATARHCVDVRTLDLQRVRFLDG